MNYLVSANENKVAAMFWRGFQLFVLLVLVYRLFLVFSYKHELVNGESNNIWNAINVAHGKPIYSNPEALPLEVFQYTPLSQFPIIALAYVLDDDAMHYLYWITVGGRFWILCLNLLTGWLMYKLLRNLFDVDNKWAFVAAAWAIISLTHPNFSIRPDALLVCALVGILYFFGKAWKEENRLRLWIVPILIAAAVMIKQDAFLLLAPFGLFLLWSRAWKWLFVYALALPLALGLLLVIGQLLFGPYFIYSITRGIQNAAALSQALMVFDKATSLFGFQFTASLSIAFYILLVHRKQALTILLSLTTILYAVFGFLSSMKLGSWVNYYTMFVMFTPILVVLLVQHVALRRFFKLELFILLAMLTGSIFIFRQVYFYTMPWVRDGQAKTEYVQKYQDVQYIKELTHLKLGDKVLTGDQLYRNFLATYTVMPNTEYYGISNFNYQTFKNSSKASIKYIIYSSNSVSIENNLASIFNVNLDSYKSFTKQPNFSIVKIDSRNVLRK